MAIIYFQMTEKVSEVETIRGIRMIGWIIFITGIFDLVLGAYLQAGIWICVPIAICWYIMMLRSVAGAKKEKFERKILLERLKEQCSPPHGQLLFL